MTQIRVDFSDVEPQDRSPIKPGKYDVVVENIEVRQGEGKEHPYLNWELSITEGEHEGRKLWLITSLSPKAIWRLQLIFQSFGVDADSDVELEIDDDTNMLLEPDLTGEAAIATVRNQLWEGKPQARVIDLAGGEGQKAKAKPEKAKASKRKKEENEEEEEEEEPTKKPAKQFGSKSSSKPAGKSKPKFR